MSLIKKPNELNVNVQIKMLIYGQPGTGKSTLALSSPKPLLIDCDGGINRVDYELIKDTVQVESYVDILTLLNDEDLSAYETLVIDTGGKMLDMMADYIIAHNPKMGKRNGSLTLEGYGQRKIEFTALMKLIVSKKKHIVFVAHRTTEKDGDNVRYVPLFGGSNYDALATELDLVGYLEADGRNRVITFDPTSRSEGKNTCNLPSQMNIPNLKNTKGEIVKENRFLEEEVFKRYVNRLKERSVEGESYKRLMKEIEADVKNVDTVEKANAFVKKVNEYHHIGNSMAVCRSKFMERVNELGYKYDKAAKSYVEPVEEKAEDDGNGNDGATAEREGEADA